MLREGLPPQASGEPEGVSRQRRLRKRKAHAKGVRVSVSLWDLRVASPQEIPEGRWFPSVANFPRRILNFFTVLLQQDDHLAQTLLEWCPQRVHRVLDLAEEVLNLDLCE